MRLRLFTYNFNSEVLVEVAIWKNLDTHINILRVPQREPWRLSCGEFEFHNRLIKHGVYMMFNFRNYSNVSVIVV